MDLGGGEKERDFLCEIWGLHSSESSGLLHHVVLSVSPNLLEECAVCHTKPETSTTKRAILWNWIVYNEPLYRQLQQPADSMYSQYISESQTT
jgi:hypothetical protein